MFPIIIALVAIIVSILALYAQTKQLTLQNYMEYTKRYQEIILHFPENINEDDFDMKTLECDKKEKTMRYMRVYYDLCFEEFDLHTKQFIDDTIWGAWRSGMQFAFRKTAFQQAWKKIKEDTQYSKKFTKFVECCQKTDITLS